MNKTQYYSILDKIEEANNPRKESEMNSTIPIKEGDVSEMSVSITLNKLVKAHRIKSFVQTEKGSAMDNAGVDFTIQDAYGLMWPIQVKSSQDQVEDHNNRPGQHIPCVNGNSDSLYSDILKVLATKTIKVSANTVSLTKIDPSSRSVTTRTEPTPALFKAKRKSLGLNTQAISKMINVSANTLYKYESGLKTKRAYKGKDVTEIYRQFINGDLDQHIANYIKKHSVRQKTTKNRYITHEQLAEVKPVIKLPEPYVPFNVDAALTRIKSDEPTPFENAIKSLQDELEVLDQSIRVTQKELEDMTARQAKVTAALTAIEALSS